MYSPGAKFRMPTRPCKRGNIALRRVSTNLCTCDDCKKYHAGIRRATAKINGERNPPRTPERRRKTQKERHRADPRGVMLESARRRAKRDGVACSITRADIQIPSFCPVFFIPLRVSETGHPCDNSPSLDRLIPTRGYVVGNVQVISHLANRLKNSASVTQLIRIADWLKGFDLTVESDKIHVFNNGDFK